MKTLIPEVLVDIPGVNSYAPTIQGWISGREFAIQDNSASDDQRYKARIEEWKKRFRVEAAKHKKLWKSTEKGLALHMWA